MAAAAANISSFFNRIDFISILLPGYVAIISYLLIFNPVTLLSSNTISFDVLSALVFIVAGPALGLALREFQRALSAIYTGVGNHFKTERDREEDGKFLRSYASVQLKMTTDERNVLNEAEALYDFSITTAVSFVGLALLSGVKLGWMRPQWIFFLVIAFVLFFGGYYQRSQSYSPLIDHLMEKYSKLS